MKRWAALLALALLSCRERPIFTCATNSQCGAGGACIMGACAFAAADCESGYRWDVSAPSRARACVALPDMAAQIDMSMPPPAHDMAKTPPPIDAAMPPPYHFYPELQRQVEAYHCMLSGCHDTTDPVLVVNDTPTSLRNYNALRPLANQALVDRLQPGHHGGGVTAGDLDAWQRWVASPEP